MCRAGNRWTTSRDKQEALWFETCVSRLFFTRRRLRFTEVYYFWSPRESPCFVTAVENPHYQPGQAGVFRPGLQTNQQQKAKNEAEAWDEGVHKEVAMADRFARKPEVPEGCQIHAHKSQQRAEGDNFRGVLPRNGDHADVGEDADDPNVVNRITFLGAEIAEDFFRQHIVAAHAVEQARRAHVSGQSAGDAGDQKHDAICGEEHGAASHA